MNVAQLFDLSNIYVLPFWALMILLPGWGFTRKVMGSLVPFVPLAGLYIYLFARSLDSETAQALANPTLAAVATFFSAETPAATGWTHFLVMDLFVGRWIYLEGQRTGIWTIHSLALCLFAGPMGVLSHIVTGWLSGAIGATSTDASTADASQS